MNKAVAAALAWTRLTSSASLDFASSSSSSSSPAFSLLGQENHGEVRRGQSETRLASKEEIMAELTLDKAYVNVERLFLRMNASIDPKLAGVIEAQISHSSRQRQSQNQNLRQVQKHVASSNYDVASLYRARDLLNNMMNEAVTNNELDIVKCNDFDREQRRLLWESQQDIDYVNAQAADARTSELKATETINTIEDTKIPLENEQMGQNSGKCWHELMTMEAQLKLLGGDVDLMKKVFGSFQCEQRQEGQAAPGAQPAAAAAAALAAPGIVLLSSSGMSNSTRGTNQQTMISKRGTSLLFCPGCSANDKPLIQMGHEAVQAELLKLKTSGVRQQVQDNLLEEFTDAEQMHPQQIKSTSLLQATGSSKAGTMATSRQDPDVDVCSEDMGKGLHGSAYRGCQTRTVNGLTCQKWTEQAPHIHGGASNQTAEGNMFGLGEHSYCRNPTPDSKDTIWCYTTDPNKEWEYCQPSDVPQAPGGIPQFECVVSSQCKMGPGNCEKLRDRFLTILAGVMDQKDQLTEDKFNTEAECWDVHKDIVSSIKTLSEKEGAAQGDLAGATKEVVENQQQEGQAQAQHQEYLKEFQEKMTECCDARNAFMTEICSLEKIRGELFKSEGVKTSMTDCEVSDWTDSECTVSCEGGTQQRIRSIIAHPVNGTACPPLILQRECNIQKCPVDCKVATWSEWTQCTAECGGGVRTRIRQKNSGAQVRREAVPRGVGDRVLQHPGLQRRLRPG